ncbi:rap guanine nucleotide exchange factor 4-like [Tropilaelaps mercedesae]|uniref:Rap guanine nucleotide exchange factor 4-like n=1 Tax=Tropilaelaps mercedesae TaxID=418985 RepID=A0A1V9XKL3_9ACAR|nr:rap guanine nucleotide exchange factor 4-like [Tropilaelaps mercedesae]
MLSNQRNLQGLVAYSLLSSQRQVLLQDFVSGHTQQFQTVGASPQGAEMMLGAHYLGALQTGTGLQQTPQSQQMVSSSNGNGPQCRKFRSHSAVGVPERSELGACGGVGGSLSSRGPFGSGANLTQLGGSGIPSSPMSGGGRIRHPQMEWQRLAKLVAPGASAGVSRLSRKQSQRHRYGHAPNVVLWIHVMDKLTTERNEGDLELIYAKLRAMPPFHRLHPVLLQELAYYGYYEDVDAGVTLFREGDKGKNWYAVLKGSLDVQITNNSGASIDNVTLCTLGVGRAFGESISCLSSPHSATVVTNECCELLRIDQKDFHLLWKIPVLSRLPTSN